MSFNPKFPWFPNVEIFIPRNHLYKHIKDNISYFNGVLLDVGCGLMPYKNIICSQAKVEKYIGMDLPNSDIYNTVQPDLIWDGFHIPLEDNSVDSILLTEVLEHCPEPELVLQEIHRVLKQGGIIVFSVPFIWYLHESPWDFYRYTPYAIQRLFDESGYRFEKLEIYGSNDRAFLHSYLIWLKKSALPKIIRFGIYLITLPFILLFLLLTNSPHRSTFKDGQMFIGTLGLAVKK